MQKLWSSVIQGLTRDLSEETASAKGSARGGACCSQDCRWGLGCLIRIPLLTPEL